MPSPEKMLNSPPGDLVDVEDALLRSRLVASGQTGAVLGIFIWVGQSKGQANFG